MKIEIKALTDVGLVRELNEDNVRVVRKENLAVVCDGMGGHAAGEIASQLAVDTIGDVMEDPQKGGEIPGSWQLDEGFHDSGRTLVHAIRLANRRIYNKSARNADMRGMGTTVVAARVEPEHIIICHVGDSRAYRLRNGNLEQMTVDHSWVNELINSNQLTEEESKTFVNKNVITRALGTREAVKVDIRQDRIADGDIYLLCSDGLCGFVSDSDILKTLSQDGQNLDKMARELIERANAAGGEDNITVALIRIDQSDGPADFEKELIQATIEEESDEELRKEDDILRANFGSQSENIPETEPEKATRPIPVYGEKRRRRKGGWLFLLFILILAGAGYLAYRYDVGGIKPQIDSLIASISGRSQESTNDLSPAQVSATTNISLTEFPDSLIDDILYVDMVPQGPARQFLDGKLLLEPGYHVLELKDSLNYTYARITRTFEPGDIHLSFSDFELDE